MVSSALEGVQAQIVTTLHASDPLMEKISAIYDGAPSRAPFPYATLSTGASRDWSHKTGIGRDLSLALHVHDDGKSAARLHRIMALVEEALETGLDNPVGWQIVTFEFRRSRIVRRATGPWTGLLEYRARCLKY